MEEFDSKGVLLKKSKVHLEIQAPVSEPAMSQICLSPEQREVSCSSEGEGAEFILSLDGQLLVQTINHTLSPSNWTARIKSPAKQDGFSVSNITVSLHGELTGSLMCNVWNNVSQHETIIHLADCKVFVSFSPVVTVAVIAGVVILLLLVALCLGIKKFNKKPRTTNPKRDNCESEVVYTDVRVMRNMKKTTRNSRHNVTQP
ncbi:uncharacterized protein LOC113143638 [Mastacembelus armatus]|uniref:uncharacterized protein LOC113143638 n=1 Tax=Mastacembelus armatus TaxID=205130 RepID=UPI000E454E2F|nr:uncharacterized protein LOC113143638 [Mastacembelus armatus]